MKGKNFDTIKSIILVEVKNVCESYKISIVVIG